MDEVLTMEEIETRFPEEWILIDQPETDQYHRILRGRVVFHGPDREEMYRKALEVPTPRRIAFHSTKKRKPGVAYII